MMAGTGREACRLHSDTFAAFIRKSKIQFDFRGSHIGRTGLVLREDHPVMAFGLHRRAICREVADKVVGIADRDHCVGKSGRDARFADRSRRHVHFGRSLIIREIEALFLNVAIAGLEGVVSDREPILAVESLSRGPRFGIASV